MGKSFDFDEYLLGARFHAKRDDRGYEWKVIKDPTRTGHHPGLFYGNLFRMIDLRLDRDEKSTWPNGILFEHIETRQQLTFIDGKLFDLTNNKYLEKKIRIRVPKVITGRKNNWRTSMRRFLLIREKSNKENVGDGIVAEGTIFSDGISVLRWIQNSPSMSVYNSIEDVVAAHTHSGDTQLELIDQPDTAHQTGGTQCQPK